MARLTIVQHGGDYREAHQRFASGGAATYQAQRYSVDFVAGLAQRHDQVAVVCAQTGEAFDEVLSNGVRAVGVGFHGELEPSRYIAAIAVTAPTHLVVTTPYLPLLSWAAKRRLPTICILADSFDGGGLRQRIRTWRLVRRFCARQVAWVGNHGLNACLSLVDAGVPAAKIVPWDWPPSFSPHDHSVRTRARGPLSLVYVGGVLEAKGVGDLIEAVALLRGRGVAVSATINGPDVGGVMAARAGALHLGDAITFAGPIANDRVLEAMRAADAVVVPSRHAYPEGMPLTIYEALSARTPILASDHPMFKGVLIDGQNATIFRASDPADMADAIERLGNDPIGYAALSSNAAAAWESLQLPVRWGDFIERWLDGGDEGRQWLADHALDSGRYDASLAQRRTARAG